MTVPSLSEPLGDVKHKVFSNAGLIDKSGYTRSGHNIVDRLHEIGQGAYFNIGCPPPRL